MVYSFSNYVGEIMFKIILIFIFLLNGLFANDSEEFPFIGLTYSLHSLEFEDLQERDIKPFGIRYGSQTLGWRTMFNYERKGSTFNSIAIEIDKILLDSIMGSAKFRPYIGISYARFKYKNTHIEDEDGNHYGIHAGFIIYTMDNVDIDISYHYNRVSGFDTLDKMQGASLALHYFY